MVKGVVRWSDSLTGLYIVYMSLGRGVLTVVRGFVLPGERDGVVPGQLPHGAWNELNCLPILLRCCTEHAMNGRMSSRL